MNRPVEPSTGTEVLYNKLKMFPHCSHSLETTLVKHFEQNCIEVIVYDPFTNKEANRVYVSARKVIYAAEFEYRESQKNVHVDTRKIVNNLACDYILKRLHFVSRKCSEGVIFLSSEAFVPGKTVKADLSMFPSFQFLEKPEGLVAHTAKRSLRCSSISSELRLNINISTFSGDDSLSTPFPPSEQHVQSARRFKMSPNSAFNITKNSPESVVEICTDSQRFNCISSGPGPFKPIPVSSGPPPVSPSAGPREPQQQQAAVKLSARRRSFAAVRDFTSRVLAPFKSSSNNSTAAPVTPATPVPPAATESGSGKSKRRTLNIFHGGLPLFKSAKKLPPIQVNTSNVSEKLGKQKPQLKIKVEEQLEKTVQGSSYIPNPVAGDAPEGVFRPTPQPSVGSPLNVGDLSMLSPQEQRKQKLYHRSVINKLQQKTDAAAAAVAVM